MPLPRALERLGGIQAQYAPSMYIGLWSRLQGFERVRLTRALERRSVVQGTLLRTTIHLVSPRDWWTFSAAVRRERREGWLRYRRGEPSEKQMDAGARRLASRLQEGPVKRSELQEIVGLGARGTNGASVWLDLVRIPPSGTWKQRRADLFADAASWITPPDEIAEGEAQADLVRSYLRGFGPARPAEIADWAGLAGSTVAAALERIELRRFRAENGDALIDLPRQPLPDPEIPAPPRFLPVWDATLLVHARRTQILPERHRPKVFNTKTPQSVPTFIVDGQVAGTWRNEKGRIELEPFEPLDSAARRGLEAEAEGLAKLHA